MSVLIDHDEVRTYLPHRYPFLLIDTVLSEEPNKSLVALKNVTANEPFFTGHFPTKPVMPGVLIIEALAQASGILTYRIMGRKPDFATELFYLTGVDNARFKRMVMPGDCLHLETEFLRDRRDLWKFTTKATVAGEMAVSADIMIFKGEQ